MGGISLKQRGIISERCLPKTTWTPSTWGWMALQKRYVYLEAVNITLFGETVLLIQLRDLKMRSLYIISWVFDPMTCILIQERRGKFVTLTHEEDHMKMRERLEWCANKPRNTWSRQKQEEAGRIIPQSSGRGMVLLASGLQVTGLQDCEGTDISCFNPLSLLQQP